MKKIILDALKARFTGVKDAILDGIADKLAKTVTTQEEATTAAAGVDFQRVLEAYGDRRATEAAETAVKNYEARRAKEHKPEPPKPEEKEPDMPDWARRLLDDNKALRETVQGFKKERTEATRRDAIAALVKDLPEPLRKPYERTPVDTLTDDDFNALQADIQKEVETTSAQLRQKGAIFHTPNSGGGEQPPGELTKQQQEAICRRDGQEQGQQPF